MTTTASPAAVATPLCRCRGRIDFCCPTTRPFEALRDQLAAAGYTAHHDEVDAEMISRRLWFRCVCHRRLTYVGLARPGSYRAFAYCTGCGHWWEC